MTETNSLERTAIAAALSIAFAALPPIGQPLEGCIFAGITTQKDGTHVAVVLLADKPDFELTWKDAMDWAEKVGGQLPTRPVAAMLFANAKDQFEAEWHWTSETYGGSLAWFQSFRDGSQSWYRQDFTGCARAVRMIPLTL